MDKPHWTQLIPDAPDDLGDWIALGDAVAKVIEKAARHSAIRRKDCKGHGAPADLRAKPRILNSGCLR
ncbi:hypothetical protein [Microvirga tunisiensis]|uniref:Uncharacterized protein n=1 Tax=Microvirga tunisiensis TaxID=2108360 RepID=A0A5N7MRJ3_9HYPH|nr:hypothetical protein [Microvirga tunisiensis]MPR11508.1 hypothetical protein [Microvirga tunisiensis]MPR29573.1 hypothetical protein [Microvirga tunisiensis]